jgi:hypothetical protein
LLERSRKLGLRSHGPLAIRSFETTFLTFVEQLDLAGLVSSSTHANKRNELAFDLEATEGKIKRLQEELRRTFDASMKIADFNSDFLAAAIKKTEQEIAEAKKQEQAIRHEIAVLHQTALTYYKKPDQVAQLVERVRASRGGMSTSCARKLHRGCNR